MTDPITFSEQSVITEEKIALFLFQNFVDISFEVSVEFNWGNYFDFGKVPVNQILDLSEQGQFF